MSDTGERAAALTNHDVDLVELRVGLSGLTAEVQRMRADLGPLAGLPLQLQAVADLQAERLTNAIDNHNRDIRDVRDDLAAESGRRRAEDKAIETRLGEAIAALREWQTWALRLVIGAVILGVLGVVIGQK